MALLSWGWDQYALVVGTLGKDNTSVTAGVGNGSFELGVGPVCTNGVGTLGRDNTTVTGRVGNGSFELGVEPVCTSGVGILGRDNTTVTGEVGNCSFDLGVGALCTGGVGVWGVSGVGERDEVVGGMGEESFGLGGINNGDDASSNSSFDLSVGGGLGNVMATGGVGAGPLTFGVDGTTGGGGGGK